MFDTTVIIKSGPSTAVQQLQNCSTNKRQTKLKPLRLCTPNLSATYEWPRASRVVVPKISFTDVCTSGLAIRSFSAPLLISFRSQVLERTSVGCLAVLCGPNRLYSEHTKTVTCSQSALFFMFYFSSSKQNRLRLHSGRSVTLITNFSFGNFTVHTWEIY